MLLTQRQLLPLSSANFLFPSLSPFPFSHFLNFPFRPTNQCTLCSAHKAWLAQLSEELTTTAITAVTSATPPEEGPIELPLSIPSIFSISEDPRLLQTTTSVLLTGTFTVFLFRSLRRRAKRAKETRFRAAGAKKSLKEEAVESLKTVSLSPVKAKSPPSPIDAFLGALIAGVFAILLYRFTTATEYALNRQALSNNYSVRQITITIRTIINGMCYLATFVFCFNCLGLFLYSGQLAINSFVEGREGQAPLNSSNSKLHDVDTSEMTSASEDQSSDDTE